MFVVAPSSRDERLAKITAAGSRLRLRGLADGRHRHPGIGRRSEAAGPGRAAPGRPPSCRSASASASPTPNRPRRSPPSPTASSSARPSSSGCWTHPDDVEAGLAASGRYGQLAAGVAAVRARRVRGGTAGALSADPCRSFGRNAAGRTPAASRFVAHGCEPEEPRRPSRAARERLRAGCASRRRRGSTARREAGRRRRGGGRPGRRRRRRRGRGRCRQRTTATERAVVAPAGATGKDSQADPGRRERRPVHAHRLRGLPLPGLRPVRERLPRTRSRAWRTGPDQGRVPPRDHHRRQPGRLGLAATPANAAACAQDAGQVPRVPRRALPEPAARAGRRLRATRSTLIELAGKVEGLNGRASAPASTDGTHDSWVRKTDAASRRPASSGTPTVLLNGENDLRRQGAAS